VADVEDIDPLLIFCHKVDHAIDTRFVAIEQVPDLLALGGNDAAIGMFLQREDGPSETLEPA
jgi:hypothetical protein